MSQSDKKWCRRFARIFHSLQYSGRDILVDDSSFVYLRHKSVAIAKLFPISTLYGAPEPTSWKSRKRTTQLNWAPSKVNSVWKERNIFIQQIKLVVSLALEAAAAAFLKLSLFSTTGNKQLGAPTTPSAATSQQVETVETVGLIGFANVTLIWNNWKIG